MPYSLRGGTDLVAESVAVAHVDALLAGGLDRDAGLADHHLAGGRDDRLAHASAPKLRVALRPPASSREIQRIEKLTGYVWPDDLRDLYATHDGEESATSKDHVYGILGGTPFSTLADLERHWLDWSSVRKRGAFAAADDNCISVPPGHIREVYSSAGWLAIACDGGNALGIDLDPGPVGVRGQVITFGRDVEKKHVLAPSLTAFVERVAELVRDGALEVVENGASSLRLASAGRSILNAAGRLASAQAGRQPSADFTTWFAQLPEGWSALVARIGSSFESLANATTLRAIRSSISELSPLSAFPGLRELVLSGSPVSDLTPVSLCGSLKTLILASTPVQDLAPLASLADLVTLSLCRTPVVDLLPLVGLKKLRALSLEATGLSNLDDLPVLPSVKDLDLGKTSFASFAGLARWNHLHKLVISNTSIADLAPLGSFKVLREIEFRDCDELDDVSLLMTLPKLCDVTCNYRHFVTLKDASPPRRFTFTLAGELSEAESLAYKSYVLGSAE